MRVRASFVYTSFLIFVASLSVGLCVLFSQRNYGRRAFRGAKKSTFTREPRLLVRPQQVLNGSIKNSINRADKSLVGVGSFCIYGNYEKYSPTLLESVKRLPQLLPGWKARVYCAVDVPIKLLQRLVRAGACVVVMGPFVPLNHEGQMWRFLPASETKPFLSLDADEIFGTTIDISQVGLWMASKKKFFLNNKFTFLIPMAANRWGSRDRAVRDIQERMDSYADNWFGIDEAFLAKEIWPIVRKSRDYYLVYSPWLKWLLWFGFLLLFAIMTLVFFLMWKEERRRK